MTRCPDCAALETRRSSSATRLPKVCERCRVEDPVLRRCRECERTLCLVCIGSSDCPNAAGGHVLP